MLNSCWGISEKMVFVVYSLCNMAQLEITVLYKTRTVKMFCYQGETNCCVLENKQKPLTWKGH